MKKATILFSFIYAIPWIHEQLVRGIYTEVSSRARKQWKLVSFYEWLWNIIESRKKWQQQQSMCSQLNEWNFRINKIDCVQRWKLIAEKNGAKLFHINDWENPIIFASPKNDDKCRKPKCP